LLLILTYHYYETVIDC